MVSTLLEIIIATGLISLVSFIGVFVLAKKSRLSNKTLGIMVSFAAGAILAAVFFDLLPEAFEALHTFTWVVVGLVMFFIFEAALHWHHHGDDCTHHDHKHPVVFLNMLGDGMHNFLDGVLIAASFMVGSSTGIATTFAVILHEIPQEIGDFAILVRGGLTKKKAVLYNFFSGIFAIIGGIVGYIFISNIEGVLPYVISLAAGGLLYIATTDVLPELHKERRYSQMIYQMIAFLAGLILLGFVLGTGTH